MPEDINCPRCGLLHPDYAAWCECGHVFDERRAQDWERQGHERPERKQPLVEGRTLLWAAAGFVLVWATVDFSVYILSGGSSAKCFAFLCGSVAAVSAAILHRRSRKHI